MVYQIGRAEKATREDKKLLKKVHPISAVLMEKIAHKNIVTIPGVGHIVNDAATIRKIFLDKKHFSKVGKGAPSGLWTPIIGPTGLVNMDGDDHLKMRRELASSFSQQIIPPLVNNVFDAHINAYFDELTAGGSINVTEIVSELAYRTLWELLGFEDTRDQESFIQHTEILRSVTEGITLNRKELSPKQIKTAKVKLLFVEHLAETAYRRENPTGVIGVMKQAGYTKEEVNSVVKSLMVTGTETVISYIPRMVALFIRSGFINDLQKDISLLNAGLDEAFRVTVPTPAAARAVTQETTVEGKTFKPGQRVILSTVSACQKTGPFNPYIPLDPNLKGLWFGAGTHMCIGLPIAKAQASRFVETLLAAANGKNIIITQADIGTKGHTGSYSNLTLTLERHK